MRKFLSIMLAIMLTLSFAGFFGPVNTLKNVSAQGENISVQILLPHNGDQFEVCTNFYVNAVITNKGEEQVSMTATINPGLTAELVTGEIADKMVIVPAHGNMDVWWRLHCKTAGDSTITVTFDGVSDYVTIHQWEEEPQIPKKVEVDIIEYPEEPITPCTDFTIKVKYTNLTDEDITNFSGIVQIDGPAIFKNDQGTKLLGTLKANDFMTSIWNFHCEEKGYVNILATCSGDGLVPENIITDSVIIDQGQEPPEPPEPDSVTLGVSGPDKICTQGCGYNTFQITAKICNYWVEGYPIYDVKLTLINDNPTLAQIQPPVDVEVSSIPYNSCYVATWDVVCIQKGPVEFTVDVDYKVWDPDLEDYVDKDDYVAGHVGANLATSKTHDVEQMDIYVTITDPFEDPVTHYICENFDVTAVVKNCLCFVEQGPIYIDLLANGVILPSSDVEFNQDNLWVHVIQYNEDGEIVQDFDYNVNTDPDNPGRVIINNICACCTYQITWHLHCIGESEDTIEVRLTDSADPPNIIDSDTFDLHQIQPPTPTDLTKGIFVFPGWYSDGSLRLTPDKGIVEREEFAVSQNWTAVVIVSNIGDRDAEDVEIDIGMTGDFDDREGNDKHAWLVDPDTGERIELINFSSGQKTFEIGDLKAGESKKLIFEAHCSGPENVKISVPVNGIRGFDPFGHRPIGGQAGGQIYHVPNEETVYQKPIEIIFINPEEGEEFDVCETFAVKVKIENNDPEQDLNGVSVTLKWSGNAELPVSETNPRNIVSIPHGDYREVGWNIHCTGGGDVIFWVELTFTNTDLYIDYEDFRLGTFDFRTIHQIPPPPEPDLEVTIISPLEDECLAYYNGDEFPITAKVKNNGAGDAVNVVVELDFEEDYFMIVEEPPETTFPVLEAGEETPLLTWTLKVLKGDAPPTSKAITVKATADNANPPANAFINVYPVPAVLLKLEVTPLPDNKVIVGSNFDYTVRVTNLGWADAYEVYAVIFSLSDNIMLQPGFNDLRVYLGTLQGHGGSQNSKEATFHLQCEGAGKSWIIAFAVGKDEYGYSWGCYDDPPTPTFYTNPGEEILSDYVNYVFQQVSYEDFIRVTSPVDDDVYGTSDTIHTEWTVQGFESAKLLGAKVRVLFYNGFTWEIVAQNLSLESGTFDIDLSTKTIVDPLRCRVRVGVYSPSTGMWLSDGIHQFYDEVGHFWVTDETPTKYIKTTSPNGNMIVKDNDTINVFWDVEGFEGSEGKIRVLFYSGKAWHFVAYNLPLQDGNISFNLSAYTIDDPMRCRVRVGVYVPDPIDSQFGDWYMEGDQAFYDETGHFWALP